jgi:Helix-turn-helix domain
MTIEEAAAFLRIGRSAAYELSRQWRASNGESGIPVITLGRCRRVPRTALAQLIDMQTSAA